MSKAWAVLDSAIESQVFPGAQVAIVHNGDMVENKGLGRYTYDPLSREVSDSSIYDVASLTKVLSTAPVFMKLMSQYQIGLDHEVSQYYPEFKAEDKKDITILIKLPVLLFVGYSKPYNKGEILKRNN